MNKKTIVWGSIVLGIIFVALSLFYFVTPAGALPAFMPGFEAGSSHIHLKHAIASLVLAIALFILAWFKSGPKSAVVDSNQHN
jgi:uncharacterized membrane-anchored protein YitT (DUF2179 family)